MLNRSLAIVCFLVAGTASGQLTLMIDDLSSGYASGAQFGEVENFKIGLQPTQPGGFGGIVVCAWIDHGQVGLNEGDLHPWLRQGDPLGIEGIDLWNGTASHQDLAVWPDMLKRDLELALCVGGVKVPDVIGERCIPFVTAAASPYRWHTDAHLWLNSAPPVGYGRGFETAEEWETMLRDAVLDQINDREIFRTETVFRRTVYQQASLSNVHHSAVDAYFDSERWTDAVAAGAAKITVQAYSVVSQSPILVTGPTERPRLNNYPDSPVCTDLSAPAVLVVPSRPADDTTTGLPNTLQPDTWEFFDAAYISPVAKIQFPVLGGGHVWRRIRSASTVDHPTRFRVRIPADFVGGNLAIKTGLFPMASPLGWIGLTP